MGEANYVKNSYISEGETTCYPMFWSPHEGLPQGEWVTPLDDWVTPRRWPGHIGMYGIMTVANYVEDMDVE